jgi:hypothetical protein
LAKTLNAASVVFFALPVLEQEQSLANDGDCCHLSLLSLLSARIIAIQDVSLFAFFRQAIKTTQYSTNLFKLFPSLCP